MTELYAKLLHAHLNKDCKKNVLIKRPEYSRLKGFFFPVLINAYSWQCLRCGFVSEIFEEIKK